jgi:hypothetical protein
MAALVREMAERFKATVTVLHAVNPATLPAIPKRPQSCSRRASKSCVLNKSSG